MKRFGCFLALLALCAAGTLGTACAENAERIGNFECRTLEDGTFEFNFSPLSSYIGRGDYTIQNDKLILETSDGDFTYTFDMSDGSLIFDGTNSSDFTWYADFTNGAVFTQNSNT